MLYVWCVCGVCVRASPQQHVAGVTGSDAVEGVHAELVGVTGAVLRTDVGATRREEERDTHFLRDLKPIKAQVLTGS